jgi:CBS domain-containing protein
MKSGDIMVIVKDIMVTNVIKVKESESVKDVLKKMAEHHVGGLPIVNEKNELKGYISDGDIMRYLGKYQPVVIDLFYYRDVLYDTSDEEEKMFHLLSTDIKDLSPRKVISVNENCELGEVAKILGDKRIKKVPVLRGNTLVGIISRGDLIRGLASWIDENIKEE